MNLRPTLNPGPRSGPLLPAAAALLLLAWAGAPAAAQDKSGVGSGAISVPSGPGSLEGLGESFQPSLNSGTAKYEVKLQVPPGPVGFEPVLRLVYESGNGNGPLGIGWDLGNDFVQRRTDQGTPTYGLIPNFPRADTFITDAKEELVPTAGGYYFCKNEGAFVRYQPVGDHWEGTTPTGVRLQYGLTHAGRIEDTNSSPPRVFRWLLERETDPHGNTILFTYTNFPGAHDLNQKYLAGMAYGAGSAPWVNFLFVHFVYEDRPDWSEDCRAGFPVRTGKRLRTIYVGTQGPVLPGHLQGDFNGDGLPDNLDRRYDLAYPAAAATNNAPRSLLGSIQEVGADGVSTLPAETFGYHATQPPALLAAAGATIFGTNEPRSVMDNPVVEFFDANGDGLPDIITTDSAGGPQTVSLNRGTTTAGGKTFSTWSLPQPMAGAGLAANYHLATPTVHLADMDGDGLADLVVRSASDDIFFFPNQGSNSWGNRLPMSVADYPPPAPYGVTNVRTADLDFDKRMDILQCDGLQYRLWLNLGNGQYFRRITVPQTNGFDFALPQVQIADFNGDRVPDVAWVRPNSITVTPGLGYAQFGAAVTVSVPDFAPGGPRFLNSDLMARAKLVDIDGDGLADLVIERVPGNEMWYWLNQGNYTLAGPFVITGMPSLTSPTAVTRWADLNGSGTADWVLADSQSTPRLMAVDLGALLNAGVPANALTAITNGIGGVTLINYTPASGFALADAAAGDPWTDPLPFPMSVVGSVTNLDSLGGSTATRFSYHHPYYDPVQHQFRGFARADETAVGDASAPSLLTRTYFDTGKAYEAMKGKAVGSSVGGTDGSIFQTVTNTYAQPPVILYQGLNGTNVSHCPPAGSQTMISELGRGAPRVIASAFAYDRYGNETMRTEYGVVADGDPTAGLDERVTTTVYALNTNAWLLRRPARREIGGLTNGVLSRVEFYYDDPTYSGANFGQVSVGDETLRRAWTNAANPTGYLAAARGAYDAYGNAIQLLDPLAVAPGGLLDPAGGHAHEVGYDPLFHTYPVTETAHVGKGAADLVFQADYDYGWGEAVTFLDFNGHSTRAALDPLGRITALYKPGDAADYPSLEFLYALAVPTPGGGWINYTETRALDTDPGVPGDHVSHYLLSRHFMDGWGRSRGSKSEAEPAPGSATPRVTLGGLAVFNARGAAVRSLNPCFSLLPATNLTDLLAFEDITTPGWQGAFEAGGALVNLPLAAAHQTRLQYDALLRGVAVTNADGTYLLTTYGPLQARSTDENQSDPAAPAFGGARVRYWDGLGRLVAVDEVTQSNDDGTPGADWHAWTTRFQYDVNNELAQTTDSQGNVQTITSDGLMRTIANNDPDRGSSTFQYDDASNLVRSTDAKGQVTTRTYDGMNRLLGVDFHDEALPYSARRSYNPALPLTAANRPDIAYFYDVPAANLDQGDNTTATARNTKGRRAYAWSPAGEEHYSFDDRGRPEYIVTRMADPGFYPSLQGSNAPANPRLVAYKTALTQDSLDRPISLTYPDNDQISYQYNQRGLASGIVGGPNGNIIAGVTYAPSATPLTLDYGNGVRNSYQHDNRLRPVQLQALRQSASAGDPNLIKLGYTYDPASNIRQITDLRPASAVPAGDPRRNTQIFQYDDLYRLQGVQYSFHTPGQAVRNDGQINYRYDRIGNSLAQASTLAVRDPVSRQPLANVGTLTSGGTAGTWNRHGRAPGDPAGPHALTHIAGAPAGTTDRDFAVDDNGNVLNFDGLACTWDFNDRLVIAENTQMRAEYTYDHLGRRARKSVTYKPGSPNYQPSAPTVTTLYPSPQFEVREHDAPTKYVYNGGNRVAHVTGALSNRPLRQRLRLTAGWNLCSLTLATDDCAGQLAAGAPPGTVVAVCLWSPTTGAFTPLPPGGGTPAGAVLWINVAGDVNLSAAGTYQPPADTSLPAGGSYFAPTGFDPWALAAELPANATAWQPQAGTNAWWVYGGAAPPAPGDFPAILAPGSAAFVQLPAPAVFAAPAPALQIRYYHQDHLGSAASLTDAAGNLVSETAYLPYGGARSSFGRGAVAEPYGYIQVENDAESGLLACGARQLAPGLGRFLSVDPRFAMGDPNPQRANLYAYCGNQPFRYLDPNGENWLIDKLGIKFSDPKFVGPNAYIVGPDDTLIIGTETAEKENTAKNQALYVGTGIHARALDGKGNQDKPVKGQLKGVLNLTVKAQVSLGQFKIVSGKSDDGLWGVSAAVNAPYVSVEGGRSFGSVGVSAKASGGSIEGSVTAFGVKNRVELGLTIGIGYRAGAMGKLTLPFFEYTYDATPAAKFLLNKAAEKSATINAAQTAFKSGLQTYKDTIVNTIKHPVDTAKSIGNAASDAAQRGLSSFNSAIGIPNF